MQKSKSEILTIIGKWRYPGKKFVYEKTVLIKQTNTLGNTYFSNYVEWEGEARENFFLSHPAALEFLKIYPNIIMVTHSLFHRFLANAYFGDHVRIELTTRELLDYSLVIIFRHYRVDTNLLLGEGWQKICFMDQHSGQLCSLPRIVLDLAESVKEEPL